MLTLLYQAEEKRLKEEKAELKKQKATREAAKNRKRRI